MTDLKDLDALQKDAIRAKHLGFQGKLCIHPNQIKICNDIFSPSEKKILEAKEVMHAFAEAEAKGVSAIQFKGKLVDAPFVEHARRILRLVSVSREI
ncbi:MAG: L-malyl-CoA/beta-methylmalyl-CoA lyase [Candidatus Moanabacter tarae]|uniref:L-malyl-CoA/beta-methylmalyl-CoA lyase n=1 Tax=Candidatus Moanibacter tarae TaxID=2200854 RepID=A0A2Z4ADV3_9BACT|nr:MAG: L-malyl-CoA/beta-methylmalyl-CoA lyase [Candidatus Moanabacter tarae]|tara:strand:- start:26735 stop:27025 length:291 start_codon:yes stop_codon:yes gene_type:complete